MEHCPRALLPGTTSHDLVGQMPARARKRVWTRACPRTPCSPKVRISVRPSVSYAWWPSFPAAGAGACSTLASAERARTTKAMTRSPEWARSVRDGWSRAESPARTTALAGGDRQRRRVSRAGPAYLRRGRLERRGEGVRRRSSGGHERGSGRRLSQAGPAPESGDGIWVWFRERY
jgi:hypothetical protein